MPITFLPPPGAQPVVVLLLVSDASLYFYIITLQFQFQICNTLEVYIVEDVPTSGIPRFSYVFS